MMIAQKTRNKQVRAKKMVSAIHALLHTYKWGYKFGLVKKIKRIKNKELLNDADFNVFSSFLVFIDNNKIEQHFNKVIINKLFQIRQTLNKIDKTIKDFNYAAQKR
jgi:hypothetical protein